MFQTIKTCFIFSILITESWSFLTFKTSGSVGQGQNRQTLGSGEPFQIGGGLLLSGFGTRINPTFGITVGSNVNSKTTTSSTATNPKKTSAANGQSSTQSMNPPVQSAGDNELMNQPIAPASPSEASQVSPAPVTPEPGDIASDPPAEDDFHFTFSILSPTLGSSKKAVVDPILLPIQFYSVDALNLAGFHEDPDESYYGNYYAW